MLVVEQSLDLSFWSQERREGLDLLLHDVHDVRYEWSDEGHLLFDRTQQSTIEELLALVEGHPSVLAQADRSGWIASRSQRMVGFFIDGAIVCVALIVMWLLPIVVQIGAVFLYDFIAIGMFGRTVGKALAGFRIVDATSYARPSGPQALMRALVPMAPTALAFAGGWLASVVFWVVVLVYAPILFTPLRQGVHDRLAATIAVDARYRPGGR